MGTGGPVPGWVGEIEIMERTGWTEKQLHEDVSLGTIIRMHYLNKMRAEAEKVREAHRGTTSAGASVKDAEFRVPPGATRGQ